MQKDDLTGDEFDGWMRGGGRPEQATDAGEGSTKSGSKTRPSPVAASGAVYKKLLKPKVLVPLVLGVGVISLVLIRGGGQPAPPVPDQYSQLATVDTAAAGAALRQAEEGAPTHEPVPESQPIESQPRVVDPALAAVAPEAAEPEAAAYPAPPAAGAPVEPAPPAELAAPVTPALAAPPVVPAVDENAELRRRVASLEGDLDRAQQARRTNGRRIQQLERQVVAAESKAEAFTVVSVLVDGVVVRSSSGAERVYGVGSRIEP